MVPELGPSRQCHAGAGIPGKISVSFGHKHIVPHFTKNRSLSVSPCVYITLLHRGIQSPQMVVGVSPLQAGQYVD